MELEGSKNLASSNPSKSINVTGLFLPITVGFKKLNTEAVYDALKPPEPGTIVYNSRPELNIEKGLTETTYNSSNVVRVNPIMVEGEITGGQALRFPSQEEQEKERNKLTDNSYKTSDHLMIIDKNEDVPIKKIEILIDPIFTTSDKELTAVLGHELLGHAAFNIMNSLLGYIWNILEDSIKPTHAGHAKNNPSGEQSTDVETDIRKKFSELNKQFKKMTSEKKIINH